MLDQARPGPPFAGLLGPAYVHACVEEMPSPGLKPGQGFQRERKPEGREGEAPPGQEGPAAAWGQGCDSNLQHVFI